MSESEFSQGRAFDGDITGRANRMLYILLAIFACSGIGLLAWGISRDYRQTIDTHARQLDVRAMVAEELYLTGAGASPPAGNGSSQPVGTAAGQCPSGQAGTNLAPRPVCKVYRCAVFPWSRTDGRVVASSGLHNLGLLPQATARCA